jgi:opacity protein-like surface antigen
MRASLGVIAVVVATVGTGAAAQEASGTSGKTLFGRTSQSVTYGPYLRFEAGRAATDLGDASWLPPGSDDPRVFFDMTDDDTAFVGAAVGFDWMNGLRGEVGLLSAGRIDATGPWSFTVPAEPGPHADITAASVQTTALMGSLYYAPLERRGVNSRVQPYVVAGLGLARNDMSDWTRSNATAPDPVRSFEGKSKIDIAFSVGLGVEMQLTRPGQHPVLLDLSWRYYDFGTAEGGTTPLTGGQSPREAFSVERRDSVLSLGIRVPLKRY